MITDPRLLTEAELSGRLCMPYFLTEMESSIAPDKKGGQII